MVSWDGWTPFIGAWGKFMCGAGSFGGKDQGNTFF
jgi:hypothetical protein